MVEPALGAAAGLGRWCFVGVVAVLPLSGNFQRNRQHPATTAHRALPVCECPALGMPRGTERSNAALHVCNRGTTIMQRVKIVRSAFSVQNCRQVFVVRGQINADSLVCIFYCFCIHSAEYENVHQNDKKISSC